MYSFIVSHEADRGSLERFYIIPGSQERRERFNVFYKDQLQKLNQLPFESMSVGGRVDFQLTKRDLENELFLLSQEEKEAAQATRYTSLGDPIYQIEKQRRRGLHLKSDDVAKQLNDIRKSVIAATKKLPSPYAPSAAHKKPQCSAKRK